MSAYESTVLFVVGDRFEAFAQQTSAVTVSGVIEGLRAGSHRDGGRESPLVLAEGQGVTSYDWERISAELADHGLLEQTVIHRSDRGLLSGHKETHKHRECNVLIAGFSRTGENTFRASLRLHNDQELQLDHQASHVQGMVVLEAARQMYLAVCERHCSGDLPEQRYSYVFDRLETSFRNFLFPLETTLDCDVRAADINELGLPVLDLEVRFRQAGLLVATVRMVGTALPADVMARKEQRGANHALRHALKSLPAHDFTSAD